MRITGNDYRHGSSYVAPSASPHDPRDIRLRRSVELGKSGLIRSECMRLTNLLDIVGRKPRSMVVFAPLSVSHVVGIRKSIGDGHAGVLQWTPPPKVGRITAHRIVAKMHGVALRIWRFTVNRFAHDSMGLEVAGLKAQVAVTSRAKCSSPYPAFTGIPGFRFCEYAAEHRAIFRRCAYPSKLSPTLPASSNGEVARHAY